MEMYSLDTEILPTVRMVGRIKYSKPWIHFQRKLQKEYVVYVIIDGEMFIKEDIVRYHLEAGDFFILEPGLQHEGYASAICDYYYFHFSDSGLFSSDLTEKEIIPKMLEKRRASKLSYCLSEKTPTDGISYLPKVFKISHIDFREKNRNIIKLYQNREELYKQRVSVEFLSFLCEVAHEFILAKVGTAEQKHKGEILTEELLNYLNNNYTKKINSSDIEIEMDMNFDYLNRIFSQFTGNTIFRYLNSLRIKNSKELIATTNLSFGQVGEMVGFPDKYYFSKLFHKETGMTATEYYKRKRRV